jgi:hypothetical protein
MSAEIPGHKLPAEPDDSYSRIKYPGETREDRDRDRRIDAMTEDERSRAGLRRVPRPRPRTKEETAALKAYLSALDAAHASR